MVGRGRDAVEVAKTVLEVAEAAWTALEHHHHQHDREAVVSGNGSSLDEELASLKSENCRLRNLLEQNLKLLQNLSLSPSLVNDCPPDLYARLITTVDSENFVSQLKSLHQASADGATVEFPFKEATGSDLHSAEILINVDLKEPSWWVWVTDDMVPSTVEERSGLDDESYVIVSEEHVVDGVATFIARCILSNPKAQSLKPEELQKSKFTAKLTDTNP